ncbi:NAD(P)/FAD-dependent oxidoreductase [Halorussus sp. MSC15.2]|uniref:NAD(P)/FAD-dependent oxidoreductase n=1 Tax=Halorussus sp. MSC15.2 TaxID=2283638 RepID=UPI0013D73B52|nr:NAD(P)/FAD-dependent oxidoreductase [Halorussus sp. MSC15.2]NEU56354.1 NAD(P)/FAD-dependent oxidoreductase [Halorussus sp. MSC15.2]
MKRVDVAIVGGGPAGTSAARAATEEGADALLVEKGVPRADREELGPDSTDAAGMLDYWVDIMDIPFEEIPDHVVLRELDRTEFLGPNEDCVMEDTGIESSYDGFGFTFDRPRMDDWLRDRAERAGAEYRVGVGVTDVETDLTGSPTHTLRLSDGEEIEADYLVLADGPQRQVTMRVLDRLSPDDRKVSDVMAPNTANHIAYQEYREFPEELFDDSSLKFWWGVMPGETAYPWVFPNDGTVARVGLTMPIGMTLDDVDDPESYDLLRPEDETLPRPAEYIERLLEREYGDEYDPSDFPLVEDRGKSGGTETYPISSTRPIDSPTAANVAVVGGAMGTTSAFHEGGYHVAVRTGAIAGELAGKGRLDGYNDRWKEAIGDEITRNVTFADIVADYGPDDWDRTFSMASDLLADEGEGGLLKYKLSSGLTGAKLVTKYKTVKRKYRKGKYVQFREDEYEF